MATKAEQLARRAILLHALAKHVDRQIKDCELRDELEAGGAYDVDVTIAGTIGRASVNESVAGQLTVGHDSVTKKSAAPDQAQVLAIALQFMPQTRAEEFRGLLSTGDLPDVPMDELDAATRLLQRARRQLPDEPRRGSVSFVPAAA